MAACMHRLIVSIATVLLLALTNVSMSACFVDPSNEFYSGVSEIIIQPEIPAGAHGTAGGDSVGLPYSMVFYLRISADDMPQPTEVLRRFPSSQQPPTQLSFSIDVPSGERRLFYSFAIVADTAANSGFVAYVSKRPLYYDLAERHQMEINLHLESVGFGTLQVSLYDIPRSSTLVLYEKYTSAPLPSVVCSENQCTYDFVPVGIEFLPALILPDGTLCKQRDSIVILDEGDVVQLDMRCR